MNSWDRVLRWVMKWYDLNHNTTLDRIKYEFIKEFKLPHTDQQGLLQLWDIKQWEGEPIWDCMHQFKDTIGKLIYPIDPHHQRD